MNAIQKFMDIKGFDIAQMMDYGTKENINPSIRKQQIRRLHWILIQIEEEMDGEGFNDIEIEELEFALLSGKMDDFIYG